MDPKYLHTSTLAILFHKIQVWKILFCKIHFRKIHFRKIHKNNWGPLSSTFHVGRPETLAGWKSESVTEQRTDRHTWVGARDTCVSKKCVGGTTKFRVLKRLIKIIESPHPLIVEPAIGPIFLVIFLTSLPIFLVLKDLT